MFLFKLDKILFMIKKFELIVLIILLYIFYLFLF